MAVKKGARLQFVICIDNRDCDDLELRKVYRVLPDERAAKDGLLRIIDESEEDYLYPQTCFASVELSKVAEDTLLLAA